jgi:hypothetical protein
MPKDTKTKKVVAKKKEVEEEETAIKQLEAIRLQFATWEGGHVWDGQDCLLCDYRGKRNAPKCVVELFQLALRRSDGGPRKD